MKKCTLVILVLLCFCLASCTESTLAPQIAVTTLPVFEFTSALCQNTDLTIAQIITENVSCLHDYTLNVSQMRIIEGSPVIILSGAGLETFIEIAPSSSQIIIDASASIELHQCNSHDAHEDHYHDLDSHIWLSPDNAKIMADNICSGLCSTYPQYAEVFISNLETLMQQLDALDTYGSETLTQLHCRDLITFHDGFHYFADAFNLTIIESIEEESGSEASASDLITLKNLVEEHNLPAIFTERNGSMSAASIIAEQTGVKIYTLDMAMSGSSYFDAMYSNIDTIKEALG